MPPVPLSFVPTVPVDFGNPTSQELQHRTDLVASANLEDEQQCQDLLARMWAQKVGKTDADLVPLMGLQMQATFKVQQYFIALHSVTQKRLGGPLSDGDAAMEDVVPQAATSQPASFVSKVDLDNGNPSPQELQQRKDIVARAIAMDEEKCADLLARMWSEKVAKADSDLAPLLDQQMQIAFSAKHYFNALKVVVQERERGTPPKFVPGVAVDFDSPLSTVVQAREKLVSQALPGDAALCEEVIRRTWDDKLSRIDEDLASAMDAEAYERFRRTIYFPTMDQFMGQRSCDSARAFVPCVDPGFDQPSLAVMQARRADLEKLKPEDDSVVKSQLRALGKKNLNSCRCN